MATNLNRWDAWYKTAEKPIPYGDTVTYFIAEEWLRGLSVEDWGCGYAWFKKVHDGRYLGIDGTNSKWCDNIVDLTEYTSKSQGILLRHVLEHNHDWKKILDNAVQSFTKRLCIVLFTPLVDETMVIADNVAGFGVPDIAFNLDDILSRIGYPAHIETMKSGSIYGEETVIKVQK